MWPFGKPKPKQRPIASNPYEADARVESQLQCPICGQSFANYSLELRANHLAHHQQQLGLHGEKGARRLGL